MAEIIGTGIDEEELRRQREEAERIAREEAEAAQTRAAEETAKAQEESRAAQTKAAEETAKVQQEGAKIDIGPTNRPFTADQSFLLHQRAAVRETDTDIVKVGELDRLPLELEEHREMLEERNREGKIMPSAANDWGTNRIDIDIGSVKDDRQAAYFATTLATDGDKLRFFSEYAKKNNLSYEKVVSDAEKMLGERLFSTPQTNAGKSRAGMSVLAGRELYDPFGNELDLNTAKPDAVISAIRSEANDSERKKLADAFVELTQNPASPYYGVVVDEAWLNTYRDSKDLPKAVYKEITDGFGGLFSAMSGEESKKENLGAYTMEYNAIMARFPDNAYAQKVLLRELNAAFKSQTDYEAPNRQQVDAANEVMRAARAQAQQADEDERSLWSRAWDVAGDFFRGFFPDKEESDAPAEDAAPEASEPAEPESETIAQSSRVNIPGGTLVASASPTPIPAGDRTGEAHGPAQQEAQTPTIDEQIAMRAAAAKETADSGVHLADDPSAALEYANAHRYSDLDAQTQKKLEDDWKNDGAQILLGVLTPQMLKKHQAGNEPADRVRRMNMEQLGDTLNRYSMIASGEDFPNALYGDMMYAMKDVTDTVDELIRSGDREALGWYDPHSDLPAYEQYIEANPDCVAGIESVLTELDGMREEKAAHDAQIKANEAQMLDDARTACINGVASAEQRALVEENAQPLSDFERAKDPTYANLYKEIDEEYFAAASYMGSTGGFYESWTYKTMEARGVTNAGYEQEAEYFGMLQSEMKEALRDDMDVAASLGMTLEQYYARSGGAIAETLAMRAHESLTNLGAQITEAEGQALDAAYGEGIGNGKLVGGSLLSGYNEVTGKACQAVYTTLQIINPTVKAAKLESDYVAEFGPWLAREMYEQDLRGLLATGEVPEALAKEIETALAGGATFELAIEPEAYGFVRSKGAQKVRNVEEWHEYMRENGTQMQNFVGGALEGITSNVLMFAAASATTGILGASGVSAKTAQMLGMMNGYGKAGFMDNLNRYSEQGYTVRESAVLATGRMVSDAAANVATFGRINEQITGMHSLFVRGVSGAGGAGTTKALNPVIGMAKAVFKGLGDEIVLDTAKEGFGGAVSDALVKPLIDANRMGELGIGTALKSVLSLPAAIPGAIGEAVSDVKTSIVGDGPVTARSLMEHLGKNVAVSLPLVLLGAVGENGEGIRASFPSVKAARKLQGQPTAENADAFAQALVEDVENSEEFVDGLNAAGTNARIAQKTAVNLLTQADPVKSEQASAKHEQAAAHRTELEASQTRAEIADAAYYERKNAGDVAGAIAMRQEKAKAQQGINEHQRELDQNVAAEDKLRGEMIAEAKAKATAQVKAERIAAAQQVTTEAQTRQEVEQAQRESGNIRAMDAEAFIEENYPNASDAEKQALRERYAARTAENQQTMPNVQERVTLSDGGQALRSAVELASRIQKKYGTPIKFVASLDGAEALYDGKTIVVGMDATQGDVIKRVLVHELTHSVEGTSGYKEMRDLLIGMKYGGDAAKLQADLQSKIRRYGAHYKKVGRTDAFTEADAMKEIVADFNGELLSGNEEMINRFVADEPSMARKVYEGIRNFVRKIRGVNDPQMDQIRKVEKLFEKALKEQWRFVGEIQDEQEGGVRYVLPEESDVSIQPAVMPEDTYTHGRTIDRNKAIADGMENVRSKNSKFNTGSKVFAENRQSGRPIQVTKDSLRHGMSGGITRQARNARMSAVIGDVLEDAVHICDLKPRDKVIRAYAMLGAIEDAEMVYPVKLIVNETDEDMGDLTGIEAFNGIAKQYLYSANTEEGTKKEPAAISPEVQGTSPNTLTGSNVRIADLWDSVKTHFMENLETLDENQQQFSLPSDDALDAEIDAWRSAHEAEIAQAATLEGESQFAQTAHKSLDAPEWWKREVRENPLLKNYAKDTNPEQLKRATRRLAAEGYSAEVKRLLDADTFDADDTVEAGAIMNIAFGQGDVKTALEMALKYRVDGKGHATAMQSRKMFASMTPTNIKIKVAGEMEEMLSDYVENHQPLKRKVNRTA